MLQATSQVKRDISALTALRGLAAWWVVLYHIRGSFVPHLPESVIAFLAKGYLAVDMFFVLSGFVMTLNYGGRIAPSVASYVDFIIRRIGRIYPLHLLMLILTAAYLGLGWLYGNGLSSDDTATTFIANIFLVHNWGFLSSLSWNYPAWSISTEMFAYLIFPFVALAIDWQRVWASVLVILMVVIALCLHLAFSSRELDVLGDDIPQMGLVRCVCQFIIGMMLCHVFQRLERSYVAKVVAILLLSSSALVATGLVNYAWPETVVLPLLWAGTILGFALWTHANPLSSRALVSVGEWSYATYMSHVLLWQIFKLLFVESGRDTPLLWLAGFLIVLLAASAFAYRFFELPAQQWVRNFSKPLSLRAA